MPSRRNSYYILLLEQVRRGYKDCMRMVNGQDLLQVIRHDLLHSDCLFRDMLVRCTALAQSFNDLIWFV